MSRKIITGLLKEKLGFEGLVFSDCLEMDAIRKFYGTAKGTVAAIKAGVDLAEISATTELMWEAAEALNQAADRGELDMEEIRRSVEKILSFKAKLAVAPEAAWGLQDDFAAVQAMADQTITCCAGEPPVLNEKTLFCGCGSYRASLVGNPDEAGVSFPDYMAAAFGGASVLTERDPDETEIGKVAEQALRFDRIVLGTCNAHLNRGQLALAEALAATGKELTVVALRNPYDIPLLPECACKLAAYDYSVPCFAALEKVFRGGKAAGILPVKL